MENIVDIIIPVYNVELFLDECIKSVLQQTYTNIRVILVDDGSKDDSLSICKKWKKKDSRVILVTQKNQGVSKARNSGLEMAKDRYILFVDADDVLDNNVVEKLVYNSRENRIAGVGVDRFTDTMQAYELGDKCDNLDGSFRKFMDYRNGYFCWGILYDNDIIQKYNLRFKNNLKNLEDVVWNIQYGMYVKTARLIKGSYYHYRDREGSITTKCGDYYWQVESWINVLKIIKILPVPFEKRLYFLKEKRRVINNLYAECYWGDISWIELKKILFSNDFLLHFSKLEYYCYMLIYKCILK